MGKKKIGFYVLLFLVFAMLFLGGSSISFAYESPQFSEHQMEHILYNLELTDNISGDYLRIVTEKFNNWALTYANTIHENLDKDNFLFFRRSGTPYSINWTLISREPTSSLYGFLFFSTTSSNGKIQSGDYSQIQMRKFINYTYDSNGNITGVNLANYTYFYINWNVSNGIPTINQNVTSATGAANIATLRYVGNTGYSMHVNVEPDFYFYPNDSLSAAYRLDIPCIWIFHNYIVESNNIYGGYSRAYLPGNTLPLDPETTPTPTPTSTPIPSGGGSTDLTETNSLISNIQDSLTQVPSGDDFTNVTSGDIIDSLNFNTSGDPYENFWGSLLTGLSTALTCTNKNSVDLDFLGETITLSVSDFDFNYPTIIEYLLLISCTVGITISELKLWRKIYISISSGDLIKTAKDMSKNDISDLF